MRFSSKDRKTRFLSKDFENFRDFRHKIAEKYAIIKILQYNAIFIKRLRETLQFPSKNREKKCNFHQKTTKKHNFVKRSRKKKRDFCNKIPKETSFS